MRYGKKGRKMLLLVFCICLLGYITGNYFLGKTGRMQLMVPAISAAKMQDMTEGMHEYTIKPTLYFGGHAVAYDSLEDIYYITQNMAGGSWSGALDSSESFEGSAKLYWLYDEYFTRFADALAEGHVFSLYCVDDDKNLCCSYRVVFTGMPIMVIDTLDGGDIKGGRESVMRLFDLKFSGNSYQETSCYAAIRGATSVAYPKKGYKLELDEKMSLLGMRRDEDWILTALYDDAGLIHTKFAHDVWQDIAKSNAVKKDDGTRMEYLELFSNDVYLGVYGLLERIDAKELSLAEGDILYKCVGYEEYRTDTDWSFGLEEAFDIKYPAEISMYEYHILNEYLDVFNHMTDYEKARSMINMENYVDHNIFTLLAYGCDNLLRKNNFYLAEHNPKKKESEYTFIMVPWDLNATWGNVQIEDMSCNKTLYMPEVIEDPNPWSLDVKQLFECYPDEIADQTYRRWNTLRKEILTRERLFGMLDEDFAYLYASGAYDRNYRRWPEGMDYWKDVYIYEYVEGRLAYLDTFFANPYVDELE